VTDALDAEIASQYDLDLMESLPADDALSEDLANEFHGKIA